MLDFKVFLTTLKITTKKNFLTILASLELTRQARISKDLV